jgi:hypothetical protein
MGGSKQSSEFCTGEKELRDQLLALSAFRLSPAVHHYGREEAEGNHMIHGTWTQSAESQLSANTCSQESLLADQSQGFQTLPSSLPPCGESHTVNFWKLAGWSFKFHCHFQLSFLILHVGHNSNIKKKIPFVPL